ncbi:hypothetical protein DL89DRAFT_318223 [Linderina pennispora]|uniref:RRM domain-containing protein n=1 Tax=Linderina pennispora TaxID=61395 RepID=A0A1Y1VT96_9FUNG|nr:uncharacterized protein DL89DRAFT_318223 [Linderina pennispora]ORX64508.1 hypothetical protein DL89DRAFT_318223 [Linderina pennispora]
MALTEECMNLRCFLAAGEVAGGAEVGVVGVGAGAGLAPVTTTPMATDHQSTERPWQQLDVISMTNFAKYGEIADIFDASIRQKGICYDWPCHGYCCPSDLRPGSDKRCPAANDRQATVLFSLVSPKESFQDKDKAYFERFGNVVSFFPYRGRQFEYVVEYYDSRSAYHAAMSCNRLQFHGGTMHTTFLWDGSTEGSVVYDKAYFDRLCGGSNDGAASFSMLSGPSGQGKPKEWNIDYGVSSGWSAGPQVRQRPNTGDNPLAAQTLKRSAESAPQWPAVEEEMGTNASTAIIRLPMSEAGMPAPTGFNRPGLLPVSPAAAGLPGLTTAPRPLAIPAVSNLFTPAPSQGSGSEHSTENSPHSQKHDAAKSWMPRRDHGGADSTAAPDAVGSFAEQLSDIPANVGLATVILAGADHAADRSATAGVGLLAVAVAGKLCVAGASHGQKYHWHHERNRLRPARS